ncbi:hypothetical protein [Companilactobacillus mishanensis]|uniref:Uncharacterized protein n=1 Tax=Companilactobacillus mishanensis TaxID=2486008 RepID=A0A5P0ZGH2_9LACO|nr:hypothetical protein [Companilactobacillus mishanensis]MQS52151.1 hypothetical protein [Companilactobacillus mishanensis]
MFGRKKNEQSEDEKYWEESSDELWKRLAKEHRSNVWLKSFICRVLEIEPEINTAYAGNEAYCQQVGYPVEEIKVNEDYQLIMTLDQYKRLKPDIKHLLRKLDLVTVPIEDDLNLLDLLEETKHERD